MFSFKFLTGVVNVGGHFGRSAHSRVRSARQFNVELERERSRVDRRGESFSVLAFGVDDLSTGRAALLETAKILYDRLRLADTAGWINSRTIGVILPDTPIEGAWRVADHVRSQLRDGTTPPKCTVYSYPASPSSGHRDADPSQERLLLAHEPAQAMDTMFLKSMPPWKRTGDVLGALVGLVVLSPLLAAVAVTLKLTSPGPIFFAQMRRGQGGRAFRMIKFRSMRTDAEAQKQELARLNEQDGPAFKIKHDPRITPLGRWLRATSIDELPQLWNVLKGDMSLVGPRPLPLDESDACVGWQRRRLDVTPGLTCIWQVDGRSRVSFVEWMRMDMRYIRSRSLWQDAKLLVKTVWAVVYRRNGY